MVPGVFDVVALAVGGVGYALGRSRGLVWQASGLLTLVGGALCATVLSRPLGPVFAEGVAGRFVAWVVVYVAVAACLYVLTLKFKNRIKELEYEELDRRIGGMVGVIKALAVFCLVTIVAAGMSPRLAARIQRSVSGQALRGVVNELRAGLPERVHDAFGPWLDAVDERPPTPTPAPAPAPVPPTAPAPAPAVTSEPPPPARPAAPPQRPQGPPVAPSDDDVGLPPLRPVRRPPPPVVEADPFDTSRDPVDPLAPPRR